MFPVQDDNLEVLSAVLFRAEKKAEATAMLCHAFYTARKRVFAESVGRRGRKKLDLPQRQLRDLPAFPGTLLSEQEFTHGKNQEIDKHVIIGLGRDVVCMRHLLVLNPVSPLG